MTRLTAICRIRLNGGTRLNNTSLRAIANDEHGIDAALQIAWTRDVLRKYCHSANSTTPRLHIRDWDLVAFHDGTVDNVATDTQSSDEDRGERCYPAEYRIPNSRIAHVSSDTEKISHRELFAIGSLLYEVNLRQKPFHDVEFSDDTTEDARDREVELRFAEARVPEDLWQLPSGPLISILCCWCPQLAETLRRRATGTFPTRLRREIEAHPARFALQTLGAVAAVASFVAIPVLGAVGFGALGPVAGSAAAAWQASMGIVRAGSIFAWCQSAAMGGAAVGGIIALGTSGGAVLVGASLLKLLDDEEFNNLDIAPAELRELFLETWSQPAQHAQQRGGN